jgi:DNA-binding NtrC family response regulator
VRDREGPQERAALIAAGCLGVVSRALPDAVLGPTLRALVERRRQEGETRLTRDGSLDQCRLTDFVSSSPAMQRFMTVVRRVVDTDSSLLILGETGVGKERLARAIHAESHRAPGPFMAVNCAALPEALLESELFGHDRGAFTGAVRAHRGAFELAHRGTIFLDEVGEMPPHLQAKLLRVLQSREIMRLGGEERIAVDVRVIAATNRDLAAEIAEKRFRPDLYYRLGVVSLTIPPLRERREDIPLLVEDYVRWFGTRLGRHVTGVTPEALEALEGYPWPGNVRELMNVIERAMLLCTEARIRPWDLPENVTVAGGEAVRAPAGPPAPPATPSLDRPWREARDGALLQFERGYLSGLLRSTGGRVGETARRAGISPRALFEKMKRHGLRKEDFRGGGTVVGTAP